MTYPWKVLYAAIPPAEYCWGWPAFIFSFLMSGALTYVIYSVMLTAGCLLGIRSCVLAITLLSVGASMPNLCYSVISARSSEKADESLL